MEEHVSESCRIVYYCSSTQDDVHELYHQNSAPKLPSEGHGSLAAIYQNVHALLDEDQGGFKEGETTKRRNERIRFVLIGDSLRLFEWRGLSRPT